MTYGHNNRQGEALRTVTAWFAHPLKVPENHNAGFFKAGRRKSGQNRVVLAMLHGLFPVTGPAVVCRLYIQSAQIWICREYLRDFAKLPELHCDPMHAGKHQSMMTLPWPGLCRCALRGGLTTILDFHDLQQAVGNHVLPPTAQAFGYRGSRLPGTYEGLELLFRSQYGRV